MPTIGLEDDDLTRFLSRDGIRKLSARDLAAAIAQQADGATTVASALALARLAGIEVLATGGIGGIHRRFHSKTGASGPIDESADLLEIERSPIVVVCAGAKAILDLPATLERLETLGVPVIGYQTSELPGFFTAETGLTLSTRVDSAREIAAIARAHWVIAAAATPPGTRSGALGILVVQPPPAEFALAARELEPAIEKAIAEADERGVRGAQVTPFLLEAVSRLTEGRSLDANLALLEQNAALAAEIAVVLHGGVERKQPAEVRAGSSRSPNVHR